MKHRGRTTERLFQGACLLAVVLPLSLLLVLLVDVVIDGSTRLSWSFLTGWPSRHPERAGILPALAGTVHLIVLTAALALPIGVGAAIYLEEYGGRGRFDRIIQINIANLAGVPSIVYGLLGLGLFVRTVGMGRSVLAGACTLALLVLPIVILASREAISSVPAGVREGAYALGATKWQVVRQAVLPSAMPGILTGSILAISRAIGETAPLIVVGALAYVTFLPTSPSSPFTALPIQIFNWVSRPQHEFAQNAAAGIVVLLVTMLLLNTVAVAVRMRIQRRVV